MNITDNLNQIIIKYHIDRYYPGFQMKLQADKLLKKTITEKSAKDKKIVFVSTNNDAIDYIKALIGEGECEEIEGYVISEKTPDKFVWDHITDSHIVYLVSYHHMEMASKILEEHGIIYDTIYDILARHGLMFEDEYYYVIPNKYDDIKIPGRYSLSLKRMGNCQIEYFFLKSSYKQSREVVLRSTHLEKMLFLSLYMKNFVEATQCIKEMRDNNSISDNIENAWAEITSMLDKIREVIQKRTCKDVIWFWMDAVSYEAYKEMTYLKCIKTQSISFSNAFTNMPYTNATLRAAFCQKTCVEDRSYIIRTIDNDSSEMLNWLTAEGYLVRTFSKVFVKSIKVDNIRGGEEKGEENFYEAASLNFWNMLQSLMDRENKYFILAHAIMETHAPCLSFKMEGLGRCSEKELAYYGKKELDEQLQFYNSFLGKDSIRIFMSDHGRNAADFLERHHIHLDIYHTGYTPQKIDGMFSILDFYPLVRDVIWDRKFNWEALLRNYVPIENLDRYNREDIQDLFVNKKICPIWYFGYKGVITNSNIYVRFNIGNEYLFDRNHRLIPLLCIKNIIETGENICSFRQRAGSYPLEILGEDKFKYSRYMHKLYEIYQVRSHTLIQYLNEKMKGLLFEEKENSVAIRTGGVHSYYVYAILSKELKQKVGSFIDFHRDCMCSLYGKEIVENMERCNEKIQTVILSSYRYREQLREEAKNYPSHIHVIDIYDVFDQMGYCFKQDFYLTMGLQEEDYDTIVKFDV